MFSYRPGPVKMKLCELLKILKYFIGDPLERRRLGRREMVGSLVAVRESSSTRHGGIEALHYGRIFKLHKRHKKGQAI